MTEEETRDLIRILRDMADFIGGDINITDAADALEATLWKPIADMPDRLKDGRELLVSISHYKGKMSRRVTMQWLYSNFRLCDDRSKLNHDWHITHYMEITPPEGDE